MEPSLLTVEYLQSNISQALTPARDHRSMPDRQIPDICVSEPVSKVEFISSTLDSIFNPYAFVKRDAKSPVIPIGGCGMIKIKVPELMHKKGLNVTDLMRQANIAYPTALRLSRAEGNAITFDVLESLCKLFDAQVKDILEYVPDKR